MAKKKKESLVYILAALVILILFISQRQQVIIVHGNTTKETVYLSPTPFSPTATPTPAPGVPESAVNCGDGIDNDGDGLSDCADPDCNCIGGYSCELWSINPQCAGSCQSGHECLPHGSICSCVDITTCTDSDGNAPETAGYVTSNGNRVNDRCLNGYTIIEGLCSGSMPTEMTFDCTTYGSEYCCITNVDIAGLDIAHCGPCIPV